LHGRADRGPHAGRASRHGAGHAGAAGLLTPKCKLAVVGDVVLKQSLSHCASGYGTRWACFHRYGDYPYGELEYPTNTGLVTRVVQLARDMGREIATPAEAQELLEIGA